MHENLTEQWRAYWDRQYDSGARQQLVTAAHRPETHWLIADSGILVEDLGLARESLRTDPDDHLIAARDGFGEFLADTEIDAPETADYDQLPIHLVGVPSLDRDGSFILDDPICDANTLTTVPNVTPTTPNRTYRAAEITYCCPAGHETTLQQPLYRSRLLRRCGLADCSNEVHIVDSKTRLRRIIEFEFEHRNHVFRCVGTGRQTRTEAPYLNADRIHVTGIPRFETSTDGTVNPVYELLAAGPT